MGAMSDDLMEEVAERATCAVRKGVFVVTVAQRRPGAVVTEVVRLLEAQLREPGFELPLKAVVDIRSTMFSPSGAELRVGAYRLRELGGGGRLALVVANDFQFGLGRMFGLLAEGSGVDVRPFREPRDATLWAREG